MNEIRDLNEVLTLFANIITILGFLAAFFWRYFKKNKKHYNHREVQEVMNIPTPVPRPPSNQSNQHTIDETHIVNGHTLHLASKTKRIVAHCIDWAVVYLIFIPAFYYNLPQEDPLAITLMIIAAIYLLIKDSLFHGQSIGKKIIGLRVINTSRAEAATLKDSLARNIFLLICPFYPLEYFVPFFNPQNQRIGDKIAGTLVIDS